MDRVIEMEVLRYRPEQDEEPGEPDAKGKPKTVRRPAAKRKAKA